ncbi:hypothetical protein Tco_0696618 [Tanacetum coccineum]
MRRDLQFADEDGTDCLPTTTIFENLKLMRFLQVFLDKQLDKVPSHNPVYNAPCHTKKVFANMKRIGKYFSRKVTPLFDTMLIQHQSEVSDSLERAMITASRLEAEHVSGSGPRRHDTMGDTIAQIRFENVSKTSYDSPLRGVNTPQSDEDSMQLKELIEMCTNLLQRVQDLETTNTAQAKEITSLKKRVKKLEQRGRSRTSGLKRLYKVGTSRRVESSTEASLDISLVHKDAGIQGRFDNEDMFDTSVFNDEEVFAGHDMADHKVNVVEKEVSAADLVTTAGEVVTTASVDISQRTMEAIETVTRSQERRTRREMERQLASVQESQRQDGENFRKL